MSFVDAWYVGTAWLEETHATFCSSARSIPTVLAATGGVAATSASWRTVANALSPVAVIDARVATPADDPLAGDDFRRSVVAPAAGRFHTMRTIGEFVLAGDALGVLDGTTIVAPASGVLSGLSARGCRVSTGMPVAEVDLRGQRVRCFAVAPQCELIANEVVEKVLAGKTVETWRGATRDVARHAKIPCRNHSPSGPYTLSR